MIRLALLSFWHLHGADYAGEAEEHPLTEIVAIWDEDPDRGRMEADSRGVEFVQDLDELLARRDIDGVIVTSPTSMHRQIALAALRAGKPVFIEKVLASTLREAQEIAAASRKLGVPLTVSMWRSDIPAIAAIRDALSSGATGDVTQLRVRDGHPFALPTPEHPDGYLPSQFHDLETAQGGILIDLCHPVYLCVLLRGLPRTVQATLGHVTGRAAEDNAVVVCDYPDGALAVAETSSATAITPFSVEVHGTRGSLVYSEDGIGELVQRERTGHAAPDPLAPDAQVRVRTVGDGSRGWSSWPIPGPMPTAFERWVGHVRAGTLDHENVELALGLSAVIEAAYLSASRGSAVSIDELETWPQPT